MTDRRNVKVMDVELAIQRELEYRRKITMLCPQRAGDPPPEDFLPLQAKAKSDSCQSLIPTSSQEDNLFCKICQVACTGAFNYRQHVKGHKHKARVNELQRGHKDGGEARIRCTLCDIWCMNQDAYGQHLDGQKHQKAEFAKKSEKQLTNTRKYCALCLIWCPDDTAFKLHLQGKNHVFKLQSLERRKRVIEENGIAEHGP